MLEEDLGASQKNNFWSETICERLISGRYDATIWFPWCASLPSADETRVSTLSSSGQESQSQSAVEEKAS